MNITTVLTVTQEMPSTYKSFTAEKELCCTHAPNSIFMTDWKRSKSSHIWGNVVLINCEKLKLLIEKAMSAVINMEGMHDEFSVKSFLQSDGGITGLLSIKMALEELQATLKEKNCKCVPLSNSYRSMELAQSLVLCKFCLNCKLTLLQDSILKLHKGAVSNVQKHMKNCHSKEY